MPEKKEVDTNTSVIQDLVQWDMGKLYSAFGKSGSNNIMVKPQAIPVNPSDKPEDVIQSSPAQEPYQKAQVQKALNFPFDGN